jgi:hypothetical protein
LGNKTKPKKFLISQKQNYLCDDQNINLKLKAKNVAYENNERKMDSVFSSKVKAGKRRTYFFDVRETRGNDYFITITESRKRFDSDSYDRHKIFLYKEDFNKFLKSLNETVNHVKTELMPDFDFDAFNHDTPYEPTETVTSENESIQVVATEVTTSVSTNDTTSITNEDVDQW